MAATLHRLRSRPERLTTEQSAGLRQLVLDFEHSADLPAAAVQSLLLAIDARTATTRGWTFVMLSPTQNAAVVRHLSECSERPKMAVLLWAEMLTGLRVDTGEVLLDRGELARRVGGSPSHVSAILGDLEAIGAISRRRAGRQSAIFVNPHVATHATGAVRDKAQASTPPIETVVSTSARNNAVAQISNR